MLRVVSSKRLDEKLLKIYKFLIKAATLIASRYSSKLIILNVEKDFCEQRATERIASLSRFNRTSNQDILNYFLSDQFYKLMLVKLRLKYPGEIYEY